MSNMYGYNDYHGPRLPQDAADTLTNDNIDQEDAADNTDHNPLQVGFWMDGDSLAPPCGSSISTIHTLLEFARVSPDDVLYDLGCGDARVCLEAFVHYHCQTIGVEIECDLVERAHQLIEHLAMRLPLRNGDDDEPTKDRLPRVVAHDLRQVLQALVTKARRVYRSDQASEDSATQQEEEKDDLPDILADLPLPTVIVMYLLPDAIDLIKPDLIQLLELLPDNFRILCNTWGIKGLTKTQFTEVKEESLALTPLLLYTNASL